MQRCCRSLNGTQSGILGETARVVMGGRANRVGWRVGLALALAFAPTGAAQAATARLLTLGIAIDLPDGWTRWVNEDGEGLANTADDIVVNLVLTGGADCSRVERGGRGYLLEAPGFLPANWHPTARVAVDPMGVTDVVSCLPTPDGTYFVMAVFPSAELDESRSEKLGPILTAIGRGVRSKRFDSGDFEVVQVLSHPATGLELILPLHASAWHPLPDSVTDLVWNDARFPVVTFRLEDADHAEVCNELFTRGSSDTRRPPYVPGSWHVMVQEFSIEDRFEAFACVRTLRGVLSVTVKAPKRPEGLDVWPLANLLDAAALAAQR